jgi:hypothetical protein
MIAFGGKESQLVDAAGDGTMVNVAPVEPVEVDGEAVVVDLSATQTLSETQEYPTGQQESAHVLSLLSSLVVLTVLLGYVVAFCCWMSQAMGEM